MKLHDPLPLHTPEPQPENGAVGADVVEHGDGDPVGPAVGAPVGSDVVGPAVGTAVGDNVGSEVGMAVGLAVGNMVLQPSPCIVS